MNDAQLARAKTLAAAIEALSTDPVQVLACRELLTLLENVSMAAAGHVPEVPPGPVTTTAVASAAAPVDVDRGLSMTPNAVRARRRRAAARAKAAQLDMFDDGRATAVGADASARTDDPTAVATPVARPLSSSSDQRSKYDQQKKTRSVATAVAYDPDALADWAYDARHLRPDLSDHEVRQAWWKFAKHFGEHSTQARAEYAWGKWLLNERPDRAPESARAPTRTPADEPAPAPTADDEPDPPESIQRPVEARLHATTQRLALLALDDEPIVPPFPGEPRAPPTPRAASA